MDLKTFVEETLCQLAEGVNAAQKRLAPLGVTINPYHQQRQDGTLKAHNAPPDAEAFASDLQSVDFDVAITAAEKESSGGGFSIAVVMAKLGAGAHNETANATVSRVRFQVVIDLPHQKFARP